MTLPARPRDGTLAALAAIAPNAARLKEAYASNLGRALLIAVNVHLLALGVYWVASVALRADDAAAAPTKPYVWIPVTPDFPSTPPPITPTPTPPGGATPTTAAPSGAVVLVADAQADSAATVATQTDMAVSQSGPVGDVAGAGDGSDEGVGAALPQAPNPPVIDTTPPVIPPRPDPVVETPPSTEIVSFSEVDPEIVGGLEGVQARVTYPRFEREIGNQGTVVIRFVVEPSGEPSNLEVARSVSPGLDSAALNAVRQTRFTPGMQNGRPVRVRMTLPVRFTIR